MKNWTRKKWTLVGTLLAIVAGFFVYRAVRADPRIAEIRQKRDALMTKVKGTMDPAEQKKLWQELRESMKDLTPQQRKVLRDDAQKRRSKEEERYFTLTDAEKTKWLDAQIDRMEQMKERWENMNSKGGANLNGQPGVSGSGGPNGNGSWNSLSAEEKENRRKLRLDNSTPEERARRDQIMKDLKARQQSRGR